MPPPRPDPFSRVISSHDDTTRETSYYWDNSLRPTHGYEAVVQQSLAGSAFFEDAKGRHLAPVGHAMLFTHNEASRYGYPPEATEPYTLRFVTFKLAALRPLFEQIRTEFGSVVLMPPESEAAAVLAELLRRFTKRTFRDRFQETELLHQLLVALYREQIAATQVHDPVEYGHHYLRDHFRSPLNLKELAARCGISREHFIRAFGRRYGEPPGELLRRLRLEQADRMLRATRQPVQEVALACGFADANTFCRAYRLRYGKTPGALRKN